MSFAVSSWFLAKIIYRSAHHFDSIWLRLLAFCLQFNGAIEDDSSRLVCAVIRWACPQQLLAKTKRFS